KVARPCQSRRSTKSPRGAGPASDENYGRRQRPRSNHYWRQRATEPGRPGTIGKRGRRCGSVAGTLRVGVGAVSGIQNASGQNGGNDPKLGEQRKCCGEPACGGSRTGPAGCGG